MAPLVNVIALRMLGERKAWWMFHLCAVPFLLVAGVAGAALTWWMW